ncbi:MAG: CpsD/CapB family tyrosine-protein kinase [Lachnospiraceae bacterium]|nr:CpsD/CapB family tyrosine-protein kinase [Lachnospiraceae bacterium]
MEQNQYWQQRKNGGQKVTPKISELPFQAKEAINVLRGNIQLSGYDLKTVAVTSAVSHEGKSSIAFRLAKSMASLHKKTLYLDCDIRNSTTLSRYEIEQKVEGLTEFLCGNIPLLDAIYKTDDPYMDIVFTGAVAPNPSELISGPLFEKMITYVRGNYDYVIVDTPPVNPVIDGTLIARHCDGTVMVIESGLTERDQAVKAKKQLEYAGVKVLGAVLNKVGAEKGGYGYGGYGYGYGYGYGQENSNSTHRKKR